MCFPIKQIREVLKSDSCSQWSAMITLLNAVCLPSSSSIPPFSSQSVLSIDLAEIEHPVGYNPPLSLSASEKTLASPDRFSMLSVSASYAGFSSYFGNVADLEQNKDSLVPSVNYLLETGFQMILEYAKPKIKLRQSQYSLMILSRRTVVHTLTVNGMAIPEN
jgi:hypothetical protein